MSINKHDGRKIKAVYWPDTETEKGRHIVAGTNEHCPEEIFFESTYHGDRDEHWIVEVSQGIEIARHNPKFIESLQWAD